MTKQIWKANDTTNSKLVGELEIVNDEGNSSVFTVLSTPERLIFGGVCNVGFIESGYIERDSSESIDETLQKLKMDLEVYYSVGPNYVSRIVCNERM